MSKNTWLKIINPVMFISLLLQAATGLLLFFRLFISHFRTIGEVHEYNGLLFLVLVITHLALNWSWIKANLFKTKKGLV